MCEIEFNGEIYNDDRIFVLYVCKCVVNEDVHSITTTIYHESAPAYYKWCVVTFWNIPRYRPWRVDHFDSEAEAKKYANGVEPSTPLISLDGRPPNRFMTPEEFAAWKKLNCRKEYDYKKIFGIDAGLGSDGTPVEVIRMTKT